MKRKFNIDPRKFDIPAMYLSVLQEMMDDVTKMSECAKYKPPKLYNVYIHHDVYTTTDFIIKILMKVFAKSHNDALVIIEAIKNNGAKTMGSYPYDIALTKKRQASDMAELEGYVLKITLKQVEG